MAKAICEVDNKKLDSLEKEGECSERKDLYTMYGANGVELDCISSLLYSVRFHSSDGLLQFTKDWENSYPGDKVYFDLLTPEKAIMHNLFPSLYTFMGFFGESCYFVSEQRVSHMVKQLASVDKEE